MRTSFFLSWTVLPLAPLLSGVVALGFVHETSMASGVLVGDLQVYHDTGRDLRFFNAYLPYLAMALIHLTACVATIWILLRKIDALSQPERNQVWLLFFAKLAALVVIGAAIRGAGLTGILELGYRNVCHMLSGAGVAVHIVPPSCTSNGLSLLAWSALLPLLAGLMAAALASAVTSTHIMDPETDGATGDASKELEQRAVSVEHTFKLVAFLLVTSTLSLVIFYRLPLALIDNTQAAALWTGYAQAITLFWGVLFTLTLVCIFGPGAVRFSDHIASLPDSAPTDNTPNALSLNGLRTQIIHVLTTLAPLLIGASGAVLETLASALGA